MRIKAFASVLAIIFSISFLLSCKQNVVSLDYTNAKDEVPQLGNLIFRFNKSLINDSLLNVWDSAAYVSFEPEIPGRFRWESPDQLVFSPSKPLAPATTYKAKIQNEVLRYSKFDKVNDAAGISFHTPALALDQAQATWMLLDESSHTAFPQIDLAFNYDVDPAALKEKLKIKVDEKEVEYVLQSLSSSENVAVRLMNIKVVDKNYDAKIIIEKGLKPLRGKNAIDENIETKISIPSPYVLTIQNVVAEHDGSEGIVRVVTSQQLTGEALSAAISFEPSLKYTTQLSDNGFIIRSDKFDGDKSYLFKIAKGLRGKIGGVLKEDYEGDIGFGELEADIKFTNNKAVYLSKRGARNIETMITNVPRVKIIISKIYENNLLLANRYGYYPQETNENRFASYDEGYEGDYYDEAGNATLGDVIYEKEIDTRSLQKNGIARILNFAQFEDRLPDFKGIYHVVIRSTKDYWVRDSRFIAVSDIGLIAKEGMDKLYVFANSLKTAEGLDGVNISLYGNNNQLLGTAATNKDGIAEIPYAKKEFSGFRPAMIIAKTADDFNYLPFNNTRVNTSRFDVGGKRTNSTGLDAFIYGERDIYRPGERINFSVLIRDAQWESPGDIPLKMKFLLPNGKELKTFRKNLNAEGSLAGDVDLSSSAITGSYSLEVYTSNDILLASQNFMVEEFVPDRIKVNTKLNKPFLRPGEATDLSINAINFFGPPAANRNYETEIQVKQKQFTAKKFSDYNFNLANQNSFFDKIVKEGNTDAAGNATISYEVPAMYANMGLLQTGFYTTVFDETGRPVSRHTSLEIFTQDIFFGVKNDYNYYFPLNQPVKFNIVSVNKDGNPASATAKVTVIKHEYRTHLVKSGSYFRYESQRDDKVMMEEERNVGSNTVFAYIPRSPGDYEIRIYKPGANSYVSRSFYSYGSWGGENSSFEVNNEGNVDIEADKETYAAGDNMKVLFKAPFSGKMLVTLENDKVISYQYVNVENRTASLDLKLNAGHLPNIYITATLIKSHEVSDIPLTVAHGFQSIKVEEKRRRISIDIHAEKSVRSRTHQKVKITAMPGSYVTLAAVDNGVLQVSDFKTPDPYNYFYQKKALQVAAFDLYPLLFPEIRTRLSSTGGDADIEMEKRVNPMPAKRINIVSYWSGIVKTNGNGEANFEFDVPQFSGEIRLMAVAYKNNCFGSAEKAMTVADPIVISTALPRFLSPGDTVTVPVTISNTTNKTANVHASLKVEGPFSIMGNNIQSTTIKANSESLAYFRVVAKPGIGVGKIRVDINGLGEKFFDETEMSVRPPSTLQRLTGSGSIAGGRSQSISIPLSDFMAGSINYHLVVSRSPVAEYAEQLKYLVQYPYGCTEQIVSAAFPQLYFGDMADLMQLQGRSYANTNIIEAIRKIKMRQLFSGAVTMWDGEGSAQWWATIYAAHFLLEARKAGFDVDDSLLETMLSYISSRLKNKETIDYYYNGNQQRKIAPKEVPYSLYVLALAGRTNVSAMNFYKANPGVLALDGKYLLSAAYAVAGDKKSFNALLPSSFSGEESVQQSGGSFYSLTRDEAIALNALLEVDPGNAQVSVMAKHIGDRLKNETYLNTQERAFSFLALGKLARMASKSDVRADIKVDGKTIATVNGNDWRGDMKALKGTKIDVVTNGKGQLYYSWEAEGISASGKYKEEDNFIKVRKHFYDRFGKPVSGNIFKQNDLVIVRITLENTYSTRIENVVLTDLLPAGFEIENPRTKDIPGMDWIKDAATPTAMDVRDDRIHFFVDLEQKRQVYYYAVRAVSPGDFKMGPVSADAMYNGEYHSYNGAGVVRVRN